MQYQYIYVYICTSSVIAGELICPAFVVDERSDTWAPARLMTPKLIWSVVRLADVNEIYPEVSTLKDPELQSAQLAAKARFLPDYTVRAVTNIQYLRITAEHYLLARRLTAWVTKLHPHGRCFSSPMQLVGASDVLWSFEERLVIGGFRHSLVETVVPRMLVGWLGIERGHPYCGRTLYHWTTTTVAADALLFHLFLVPLVNDIGFLNACFGHLSGLRGCMRNGKPKFNINLRILGHL